MLCPKCKEPMVVRYKDFPAICAFPRCEMVTERTDENDQPTKTYDESWLAERHDMTRNMPRSYPILPGPAYSMSKGELVRRVNNSNDDDRRPNWEGFTCMHCLKLNSRVHWNRLECSKCGRSSPYGMPDFTFDELVSSEWRDFTTNSKVPDLEYNDHVRMTPINVHPDRVTRMFRFDPDNFVLSIIPKESAIKRYKDMFEKLWSGVQDGTIPIRRCPVNAKVKGQLTSFLATNFSEPYLAKMKTDTTPFNEAPDVIRQLREELATVIQKVLGTRPEFNEGLVIGNYPKMKMGWHSDGEKGVGPVVASISFGGLAMMEFVMTSGSLLGKLGSYYDYDIILPGCLEEEKKRALLRRRESGELTEEQYRRLFKKLVDGITPPPKTHKPILTMPLPGSGSIMVQVGPSLNKRYLHTVKHQGMARLVFTCRSIEHEEHVAQPPKKRQKI
ncbi:hypothetical protein PG996_008172 [Apiospora saccharicola]|uniref:Alpha-ketoglutarate-dependent dioxygenase AlkB-like domain-containing protein n=1 Tax=Apiospora saccharicola TaxID=335842 RepID=A0ABR1UXA2_9PEZI